MTRYTLAFVAALATVLLAGCGVDGGASADGGPSADDPPASTSPAPSPTATAASAGGPSPGLASALADARRIAPRLESYYRGGDYPRELDAVIASMSKAQVKSSAGNRVGAYRYDAASVEFVLCVENTSGAFATYDTAPMALGDQGETGGCPKL